MSTGTIASPIESACAAGVEPTAAATMASVTMTGRRAVVGTAMRSTMPNVVRPVFDVGRRIDPAVLIATIKSSPLSSLCT